MARKIINCVIEFAIPGEQSAEQKNADPDLIQQPPAVKIGELSPNRNRHRRCHEIGGKHPTVMIYPAKRRDNGRHRRADNGRFERGDSHAGHDADNHRPSPPVGHFQKRPVRFFDLIC